MLADQREKIRNSALSPLNQRAHHFAALQLYFARPRRHQAHIMRDALSILAFINSCLSPFAGAAGITKGSSHLSRELLYASRFERPHQLTRFATQVAHSWCKHPARIAAVLNGIVFQVMSVMTPKQISINCRGLCSMSSFAPIQRKNFLLLCDATCARGETCKFNLLDGFDMWLTSVVSDYREGVANNAANMVLASASEIHQKLKKMSVLYYMCSQKGDGAEKSGFLYLDGHNSTLHVHKIINYFLFIIYLYL